MTGPARNRRAALALLALVCLAAAASALPDGAAAEQASQPASAAAGRLDVSGGGDTSGHTCAVLADASVRCWGFGGNGRLGYGDARSIGDDEAPGSAGAVDLGGGRTATAIAAGAYHTCVVLDGGAVRCWGFGGEGRLGYAATTTIGDDDSPGSAGPVDLGAGRTARAIAAGAGHTCALLDDATVRCWGFGSDGRLGYGNRNAIGDDEPPGSVGPVDLGPGRAAVAVSAGESHTCALLDDGTVRCWGFAANGQLGYANNATIGDNESPGSVGPVDLGPGRRVVAISAGDGLTCALLDGGSVRCWGFGGNGRLGYGNDRTIGDDETPGSVAAVDLGPGRTAVAISAGDAHACALLDDGNVRCWGFGSHGRLGYANTNDVGDDETPGSVAPVDLGPGRTAVSISAGGAHTCARLDDGSVRCWGNGAFGRLGYCDEGVIGDDEPPGSVGPVELGGPPSQGGRCAAGPSPTPEPAPTAAPPGGEDPYDVVTDPLVLEKARKRAYRRCLRAARQRDKRRARKRARRACRKRYGRALPGRVTKLRAKAIGRRRIVLSFRAPGSDGHNPPAARTYRIKQCSRPIRRARAFRRAHSLCKGTCRFDVTVVRAKVSLTVTHLKRHRTYHYAVAARDNVTGRLGPRSKSVKARTR